MSVLWVAGKVKHTAEVNQLTSNSNDSLQKRNRVLRKCYVIEIENGSSSSLNVKFREFSPLGGNHETNKYCVL